MTVAALGMEELAARQWRSAATPGVAWARSFKGRDVKESIRSDLVALCSRKNHDRFLSLLTMPGLTWPFERAVLERRESRTRLRPGRRPKHTSLTAVECDEAIYRASLKWIPGYESIRRAEAHSAGTSALWTDKVFKYERIRIEDFVAQSDGKPGFVWFDWNGPLTASRMAAISSMGWKCTRFMAVSFSRARYTPVIGAAYESHGGDWTALVAATLGARYRILTSRTYADTTAMHHVVAELLPERLQQRDTATILSARGSV